MTIETNGMGLLETGAHWAFPEIEEVDLLRQGSSLDSCTCVGEVVVIQWCGQSI